MMSFCWGVDSSFPLGELWFFPEAFGQWLFAKAFVLFTAQPKADGCSAFRFSRVSHATDRATAEPAESASQVPTEQRIGSHWCRFDGLVWLELDGVYWLAGFYAPFTRAIYLFKRRPPMFGSLTTGHGPELAIPVKLCEAHSFGSQLGRPSLPPRQTHMGLGQIKPTKKPQVSVFGSIYRGKPFWG